MRHLVHRVVERRDGADHAQQWRALRVNAPLLAVVRQVAAEYLSIVFQHFLRAKQQHIADAARLIDSIFHAQAGLGADQTRNVLDLVACQRRSVVQNRRALVACQAALVAMRPGVGVAHFFECGFGNLAQALVGKRVEYVNVTRAPCAYDLATQAHGVELVFAYEIGNIGHGVSKDLGSQVQGQIERVKVAPAARFVQAGRGAVKNQGHALFADTAMRAQRHIQAR